MPSIHPNSTPPTAPLPILFTMTSQNNYKSGSKNKAAGKQPAANKVPKKQWVKKSQTLPKPIQGGAATRIAKKNSKVNQSLLNAVSQAQGEADAAQERLSDLITRQSDENPEEAYKFRGKILNQNQANALCRLVTVEGSTWENYTITDQEYYDACFWFKVPVPTAVQKRRNTPVVSAQTPAPGVKQEETPPLPGDLEEAPMSYEDATAHSIKNKLEESKASEVAAWLEMVEKMPSIENKEDATSWLGREYNFQDVETESRFSYPDMKGKSEGDIKLLAKIKHHIELSGLDAASRRLAMQRLPLWLNACKLEDRDALTKGMNAIRKLFDEPTIAILRRQPHGRGILNWVLDCLTWLPRLLWWCMKWLVHEIFGVLIPRVGVYEIWTEEVPELTDWCSDFWSDKIRAFGNVMTMPRFINQHATCAPRNFYVGVTTASESVWCARTCIHNECRSLINRQLLDPIGTIAEREAKWKLNFEAFNELFPCPNTLSDQSEETLLEQFLEKYPIARRDVIRNAFKLSQLGHYEVTSYTKAFVKREWNLFKRESKRDPRCISGKGEDYLAATAPQYYHMMKKLCAEFWSDEASILTSQRKFIYTGGLTPDQIGEIVSHYEKAGYHFYEGDYSRYDGHNEFEALDAEFKWYNITDELRVQLRKQLLTGGGTQSGIRFKHRGKVASGVINTSFGNTIRGFMMVAGWCKMNNITDYVVMQLGDDNVLMFREPIDHQSLVDWCTNCGHKLEMVHRPDVDLLEYCSGRFWNTGGTRVLGPKIGRVLSRTFIANDPNMKYDQLGSYVQQVALGMRYYTWIPVLGHFLWKLMEKNLQGSSSRVYKMPPKSYEHKMCLRREVTVTYDVVAAQFYKIYGFEPAYLEDSLSDWTPVLGTHLHHPLLDAICVIDGAKDPLC